MSSLSPQGNPPPRSTLPTLSSPKSQEMTTDGKRTVPQLERSAKVGRTSSSSSDISMALQSVDDFFLNWTSWTPSTPSPVILPLDQVQGPTALEDSLYALKKQRLADYIQSVYIPPSAKPSLQAADETLLPLLDKVKGFLEGNEQVMLILGDSGAGKSTFNRHLEYELWKDYEEDGCIPLFINLPALERPEKELIAEQLKEYRFSEAQIQDMEQHRRFVLICDGYDESQLTCNLHTTNRLNQSGQRNAKLIITCRTQYLGQDYRDRFVPKAEGQYQRAANDRFREAVIAPFSKKQIETYVERYVSLEPRIWVKDDYMDKLTTIPNLLQLVKNPFLLTLCLEALPGVAEGQYNLSNLRVTRVQLYDIFVAHWLGVNKRRLQDQKLGAKEKEAFDELKDDGFEENGFNFQRDLAAAMFLHQDGRPIVDYTPKHDKNLWKATFFGPESRKVLLRTASLLSRVGNQYRFVHRSVLEFFYSCTICPSLAINRYSLRDHYASSVSHLSIIGHPLSQRSIVAEPSIVQFLAERVQLNPKFKDELHAIIELSKSEEQASLAAANAITILVRAGIRFHGAKLQGIRVPGADVSCGQFDSARLQGADLTDVNFTKSWIRQADFRDARMGGVQFGELPYLQEAKSVNSCAFSPDGNMFAVGLSDGNIKLYDAGDWTTMREFQGHLFDVLDLVFSPTSGHLLSGGWDRTVRLWSCRTGESGLILRGHTHDVTAVAFSPLGTQFASASKDKSVRVWNLRTGTIVFILSEHTRAVNTIAYLPDGKRIASGGDDGSIWIFDTQTGLSELELKSGFGKVSCIAFSSDGQQIVSGHEKGHLQLWETATGEPRFQWRGHTEVVLSVDFSSDNQWIASSSQDRTVKLWNAQSKSLVSTLAGHSDCASEVAFSPDSVQLATGSLDKTVRLWEVSSATTGLQNYGSSNSVDSAAYLLGGRCLISASNKGTVRQYDAVTGESNLFFSGTPVQHVVVSTDGLRVAMVESSRLVRILSVLSRIVDLTLRDHYVTGAAPAFSPCGFWIAIACCDKTVKLWEANSGKPGRTLQSHTDRIKSVAFSPCSLKVVSGAEDGTIQIWGIVTGEFTLLTKDEHHSVRAIAFSPNSFQIAVQSFSLDLRLWDTRDEGVCVLRHTEVVGPFAFSSCSQWIATGCGASIWLWHCGSDDTTKWDKMAVVPELLSDISNIVWTPHKLEFATGCKNGPMHIWKVHKERTGGVMKLVWSSAAAAALVATGALKGHATGLSSTNQLLLKQRGAVEGMPPLESNDKYLDDSDDSDVWEDGDSDELERDTLFPIRRRGTWHPRG